MTVAPTWDIDPWDPTQFRYWDGTQWTGYTAASAPSGYAPSGYAPPIQQPVPQPVPVVSNPAHGAPPVRARGFITNGVSVFAGKRGGTITLVDGVFTFQFDTGEVAVSVRPHEVSRITLMSGALRVVRPGKPALNIFLSSDWVDENSGVLASMTANTGIGLAARQAATGFAEWNRSLQQHGFRTSSWGFGKVAALVVPITAAVVLVPLLLAIATGVIH